MNAKPLLFACCVCCLASFFPSCKGQAAEPAATVVASQDTPTKIIASPVMRTGTLTDLTVRNPEGKRVGQVHDLLIDVETGRIRYAILSFGGLFGVGDKLFPVPWREVKLRYDENKPYITLDVSRDFLERAPSFRSDDWPDLTSDWASVVDDVFPTHTGIVTAVDRKTVRIAYFAGDAPHEHAVATDAQITRDGERVELRDLKPGEHVKITTIEQAGIRIATKIEVQSHPTTAQQ